MAHVAAFRSFAVFISRWTLSENIGKGNTAVYACYCARTRCFGPCEIGISSGPRRDANRARDFFLTRFRTIRELNVFVRNNFRRENQRIFRVRCGGQCDDLKSCFIIIFIITRDAYSRAMFSMRFSIPTYYYYFTLDLLSTIFIFPLNCLFAVFITHTFISLFLNFHNPSISFRHQSLFFPEKNDAQFKTRLANFHVIYVMW